MKNIVIENRKLLVVVSHLVAVSTAFFLSFISRFDLFSFLLSSPYSSVFIDTLPALIIIRMLSFWYFDLFSGLWRYTSLNDVLNITKSSLLGTILFVLYVSYFYDVTGFPRSIYFIEYAYIVLTLSGIRIIARSYYEGSTKTIEGNSSLEVKKILIVGAGDAGEMILREMVKNHRLGYNPIGFVDDERRKQHQTIHGYKVYGHTRKIPELVTKYHIDEVILAMPSAPAKSIKRIAGICRRGEVKFKTLPYVGDLFNGRVSLSQVREVLIEDLLGRESADLDLNFVGQELRDKVVLVTGAAGSIGSELVRQVASFQPSKVVLFERGENDLYHLDQELGKKQDWGTTFIPFIGDIRDRAAVRGCLEQYQPHYIFHAAAYKHVPMMEANPEAAVKNNVFGTKTVVDLAAEYGVEKFVLISTDKAVRPANIMGATKRIAELLTLAKNDVPNCQTHYVAVRFGNVLGSNGSVIPLFKKQIQAGGPITITHPDIIRYFMTIPEAAQLVIQAGAMGKGGELYLLEMGGAVKIKALAESLIRLSGLEPDKDIKLAYTGLRPGEKLYEELLVAGEGVKETHHEKIKIALGTRVELEGLQIALDSLDSVCKVGDRMEIRKAVKQLVPEALFGEKMTDGDTQ